MLPSERGEGNGELKSHPSFSHFLHHWTNHESRMEMGYHIDGQLGDHNDNQHFLFNTEEVLSSRLFPAWRQGACADSGAIILEKTVRISFFQTLLVCQGRPNILLGRIKQGVGFADKPSRQTPHVTLRRCWRKGICPYPWQSSSCNLRTLCGGTEKKVKVV